MEDRRLLSVFTVTSKADSGPGTLRAELALANATPGLNTIDFAIGTGSQTIALASPLPAITNPVILDGTSQPGSSGRPAIEINGANAPGDGLTIAAPGTTIEGLVIDGFSGNQVHLSPGSDGGTIEGSYLGVDPTGSYARGGAGDGLLIDSNNNLIGGMPSAFRDVISGNGGNGITVNGTGNRIVDDAIGVDASLSRPVGNGGDGVRVNAPGNTIGGAVAGAQNVISGNRGNGVELFSGRNVIEGNAIGLDSGGSRVLSNAANGVAVSDAAGNTIGGTVAPAANVISGNEANGILLTGVGTTGTVIQGNAIGTDTSGSRALGNSGNGLLVQGGASNTQVGGIDPSMRNIIAGNGANGIALSGSSSNTIQGNAIGTNPNGSQSLGNAADGVYIDGDKNLLGGQTPAANVIHDNGAVGVQIGSGHHNAILSNSIYNDTLKGISLASKTNDGIAPPVIRGVTIVNGKTTIIHGVLFGRPKVNYLLQFFGNDTVDPSGFGEGQTCLGQATIETHHLGFVQFAVTTPMALSPGQIVTATATDPNANTSAFSNGVEAKALTIKPTAVNHTTLAQAVGLSFSGDLGSALGTGQTYALPSVFGGFPGTIATGVPAGSLTLLDPPVVPKK